MWRRHLGGIRRAVRGKAPAGTWIECSSLLRCDRAWSSFSIRAASSGFSCLRRTPRITQPVAVAWKSGPFYKCSSTSELYLQIEDTWRRDHHRRTWTDDKCGSLEDHLYSFVRSLLIAADARRPR